MKLNDLPKVDCWINVQNKGFRYVGCLHNLPCVDAKYECILKKHNIPYRKFTQPTKILSVVIDKTMCEYWSPILYKTEIVTLPVYTQMPDLTYRYYQKTFSAKLPTYDTVHFAKTVQEFVEKKIVEYEETMHREACYNFAKTQLAGKVSKFCESQLLFDSIFDVIEMNGDCFKILRVSKSESNKVAIFNMKLIRSLNQKGKSIFLNVPKSMAGVVIGKNHQNIRSWENKLGVKEIRVIPV